MAKPGVDPLDSPRGLGRRVIARMGIRLHGNRVAACLLAACVSATTAWAQALPPSGLAATGDAGNMEPAPAVIPVAIEITEQLDSSQQHRGDTFALRLAQAVVLPDGTVLASGTPGRGEVVHADRARTGGKPGELILAARYLDTPQGPLRLRALRLTGTGKDRSATAIGATIALASAAPAGALLGIFIRGGQMVVPAGSIGAAKLEIPPRMREPTNPVPPNTPPNQETPQ